MTDHRDVLERELDEDEARILGRKAREATLEALRALGGEAHRSAIRDRALEHGDFTSRELAAPAPQRARRKHDRAVEEKLSFAPGDLEKKGLVERLGGGVWRLASALPQPLSLVDAVPSRQRLAELQAMPHWKYLRTPEWKRRREAALDRAAHACALDATHTDRLEVHHRSYERYGEELDVDLTVLCHDCHQLHHLERGRPRRAA